MYVLNSLWRGEISPYEKHFRSNEEFKRLRTKMQEEYKLFIGELSENGKAHFEAYESLFMEMQSFCDEDNFIDAFRLGARMMLDVLGEKETGR